MKDLIIPTSQENKVDLSKIDIKFEGIIIAYKNDNAVGYIQCGEDGWYFMSNIYVGSSSTYGDSPYELINILITDNKCTHFKVVEFIR